MEQYFFYILYSMAFGNDTTVFISAIYSLLNVFRATAIIIHLLPFKICKDTLPERAGQPQVRGSGSHKSYPHHHQNKQLQCSLHGSPSEDHSESVIGQNTLSVCWQVRPSAAIYHPNCRPCIGFQEVSAYCKCDGFNLESFRDLAPRYLYDFLLQVAWIHSICSS